MQTEMVSEERGISIGRAALIVLISAIVLMGIGYFVGKQYFWDQYDARSVVDKQVEALKILVEEDPDNLNNRLVLFDRFYINGDVAAAEEQLKVLKEKAKDHPDVVFRDSLMLLDKGETKGVAERLEKALKEKPLYVEARVLYAQVLTREGKYDKAISELDFALAVRPAAADVILEKARVYKASGDKEKALESVDKALSMVPDFKDALDLKAQLK